MRRHSPIKYPDRSKGAALVEFALVLPLLLAFTIGIIYYGYIFVLSAAVTHAAKQGAEAAASISPVGRTSSQYQAEITQQVNDLVVDSLDWLPETIRDNLSDQPATVQFASASGGDGTLVTISVTLAVAGHSSPLLPQVDLPLVGRVPPLPGNLVGVAEVVL